VAKKAGSYERSTEVFLTGIPTTLDHEQHMAYYAYEIKWVVRVITDMKATDHKLQPTCLEGLQIELTDQCQMACIHCSTCAGPDGAHSIPFPHLQRLVKQALPLGLRYVGLSGGEPFLYPRFEDLCSYLRGTGVEFSVYSCGVMADSSGTVGPIPGEMLASAMGASRIVLSLYSHDSSTHDSITGVSGSLDATLLTAYAVHELGCALHIHYVPMSRNWAHLRDVAALACRLGAEQLSVLRLVKQGRACSDGLDMADHEYSELRNLIIDLRETYGDDWLRTGAPWSSLLPGHTDSCTAGVNKLLISAEGKVFPCEAFKFTAGLRQTFYGGDLANIWASDELLGAVRSARDNLPQECAGCGSAAHCHGGCPGQRLLQTGTLHLPDPLCRSTA
jgi:radical SAM protein with 4Fe4S-binding SPASM domain